MGPASSEVDDELQVAAIQSKEITELLMSRPLPPPNNNFVEEQRQDASIQEIVSFLERNELPQDEQRAQKVALQGPLFTIVDSVLYFVDPKKNGTPQVVLPKHLQQKVMEETHGGTFGGHFCGSRLYATLGRHWWWENMYSSVIQFCKACPECAIATGSSRPGKPPLSPIPCSEAVPDCGGRPHGVTLSNPG